MRHHGRPRGRGGGCRATGRGRGRRAPGRKLGRRRRRSSKAPCDAQPHAVDGGDGSGSHPCSGPPGASSARDRYGRARRCMRGAGISWRGNWNPSFRDFFIDRIGPYASAGARPLLVPNRQRPLLGRWLPGPGRRRATRFASSTGRCSARVPPPEPAPRGPPPATPPPEPETMTPQERRREKRCSE